MTFFPRACRQDLLWSGASQPTSSLKELACPRVPKAKSQVDEFLGRWVEECGLGKLSCSGLKTRLIRRDSSASLVSAIYWRVSTHGCPYRICHRLQEELIGGRCSFLWSANALLTL